MLLFIAFIIAGVLLFIFSVRQLRHKIKWVQHSERAVGKVIRTEEINDSDGTYYRPVFEYTTRSGKTIEYRHGTSSSNQNAWPLGYTQTFIYDPAQPTQARLLSYGVFQFTVLLVGIAVALLVIGCGYFLYRYFLVTG
jgi:hypothetical protein